MNSREDRLFAAYCALLSNPDVGMSWVGLFDQARTAVGEFEKRDALEAKPSEMQAALKAAESHSTLTPEMCKTLDFIRTRCRSTAPLESLHSFELPRELGRILDVLQYSGAGYAAPDPVRAAAVAFADARAAYFKRIGSSDVFEVVPSDAYDAATQNLLEAVAAERGAEAKPERINWGRPDLESAQLQASPAPNWRALVENLKRACIAQPRGRDFSNTKVWTRIENVNAARAVSALIAALDKPEGAPPRRDDFKSALHQLSERVFETATLRKERDELSAALEATRMELAEARGPMGTIDNMRNILGASEGEPNLAAARRVVAERDEAKLHVEALRTIEDERTAECISLRAKLAVESNRSDEISAQLAKANMKLAAQDELRDAAVEYAETEAPWIGANVFQTWVDNGPQFKNYKLGRAGLRYLAAKDAAAKNGGVR